MVERAVTIKFIGVDQGLTGITNAGTNSLERLAEAAQSATTKLEFVGKGGGFAGFSKSIGEAESTTRGLQSRLTALTQQNVDLAASLGLPVSRIRELNKSLGTLPDRTQAITAEYLKLKRSGTDAADSQRILARTLNLSEKQFKALEATLGRTSEEFTGYDTVLGRVSLTSDEVSQGLNTISLAAGDVAGSLGILGGISFANFQQFEQLEAGLTNAFGTIEEGQGQFERIQDFAANTPFEVDKLTSSFLQLVNRGFVPTNEELTKLGDLAASQVKSFDQLAEAVLDAESFQFERLREFGIVASQSGDQVTLAFRGIEQTVEKTPEAIRGVLLSFGELDGVAGSLAAQSDTVSGQLSNLSDGFTQATATAGEFVAFGFTPLIAIASSLLETFNGLPPALQATVIGITGLAGALAGAIALLTTFRSLQIATKVESGLTTAALLAQQTALNAQAAVLTASTVANTLFNAQLTRQNVVLAANAIATRATTLAKQAYAIATGQAGAATLALTGRLAVLAAQAALATGAVLAIAQVFKRSEGAQFAADLEKATDELIRSRAEAEETDRAVSNLGNSFGTFVDNVRDVGPVEAMRIAVVNLQSAVLGTADANDRFGSSITILGKELGGITAQQRGAQLAQIELAETSDRLGGSVQDTIDIFGEYGQAIQGLERSLNPAEISAFTAAAAEQSKVLQEEIDILEAQLGQSEELDQQLQNEIDTRRSLIDSIKDKIDAQGGDTQAVDDAVNSSRELSEVLDELKAKYSDLQGQLDLNAAESLAAIAEQQAAGLLSEAEAQQQAAAAQQNSLEASLNNNRALLAELEEQRLQRRVAGAGDEEIDTLDREILTLQTEIANGRRSLAESNIKAAEDETKAAEQAAKEQERIEKERIEVLNEAAEEAIAIATLAETERQTELAALRRDGLIGEEEYQAELAQLTVGRIQQEIAAERDRVAALTAAGAGEDEIRKAKQRTAQLALDLIKAERDAQERLIDIQVAAINRRLQEQENASRRIQLSIEEEQRAIAAVNETIGRQQQLLQARANLQSAITDAIASEFSIAARLTEDEEERAAIEERAALIRVQQLERSQQIELQIFDLKQKQLEIQNRIAQAQLDADIAANQAEQARAQAALETLQAEGGSEQDIETARLNLQAAEAQANAFELQRTALAGQAQLLAEQRGLERQALLERQNTANNQARADLIDATVDDEQRSRLAERERRQILGGSVEQATRGTAREIDQLIGTGAVSGNSIRALQQLGDSNFTGFQRNALQSRSLVQPLFNTPQFSPESRNDRIESVLTRLEETLGRSRREVVIQQDNTANIQVAAGGAIEQDLEGQFFSAIASAANEAERQLAQP